MEVDGTDLYWPTNSSAQFRKLTFLHHTDIIVKACKELHRAGSVSNRVSTGYIRINDGSVHTVYYTVSHRTHEWQTHWFSTSTPTSKQYAYDCSHLLWRNWAQSLKFGPKCPFNKFKICHFGDWLVPAINTTRLRRKVLWPQTLVLEGTWEINVVTWERGRSLTLNSAGKGRP